MPTILITGGTGMIGKALSTLLAEKGYEVIILSRNNPVKHNLNTPNIRYASWDIKKQTIDAWAISEADAVVHLAGANIGEKRWTTKRKKEILESRTGSADLLVHSLQTIPNKVKLLISASAIGWYKPMLPAEGNSVRVETDPPDPGFLGRTCRQWEQHVQKAEQTGVRIVIFRSGIVLSREGGAFPSFRRPIRAGIAAVLGSGKQIISWIHIEDLCRIYLAAIQDETFKGIYNAVAPMPVSNKEFTRALARVMKGQFYITIHVPSFLLKLLLGEMSIEVLKSARVSDEKLKRKGFQFIFPGINSAVEDLASKSR
jgi:uncharacterized protein (TIGR01777 family)